MSLAHFAPIVCTPYVSLGSSLDWSDATPDAWQSLATLAPIPSPTVAPAEPIVDRAAREVSASVLAWRASYYAYRKARYQVCKGEAARALPHLVGPHADYVASRFRADALTDPRFAHVLDLLDHREVAPTLAPAATIAVAVPPTVIGFAAIVDRVALRLALRQLLAAIPSIPTRRGAMLSHGKRVRITIVGGPTPTSADVLRLSALDFPAIAPVDVADVQIELRGVEWAICPDKLLSILDLEPTDALRLTIDRWTLHVLSADAHYQLFTAAIDDARALSVDDIAPRPLTMTAWIDHALSLAARAGCADAQLELDGMLKSRGAKPRARKLAWRLLRATEASDASAFAARCQLLATLGAHKLRAWIDARLDGIGYDDAFLAVV